MRFFVLKQEPNAVHQTARTNALKAEGTKYGEAPRCEICGQYVGMRQWLPPHRVELETWGRAFADLAITGTDLLVSPGFKEAWEESPLVGLSEFEGVEIVKLKRHQKLTRGTPAYFRAVVARSQTEIDFEASEFEWGSAPTCPACRLGDVIKRWKRIIINQNTWMGEDVFVARGLPGEIIASERFKDFYERNHVENCVLLPTEMYTYDFYPEERKAPPTSINPRPGNIRVVGVHPVLASQPCHLIELEIEKHSEPFDWGAVTQEAPGQPRANWQAAYNETQLNDEGKRWAFFIHYLDFSRPLLTPAGSLELPAPTPLPDRLNHVKYQEP